MPADAQTLDSPDDPEGPPQVTTTGPVHRTASRLLRRERRLLAFAVLATAGSAALLPAAARVGYRVFNVLFAMLVETLGGASFAVWGETWGPLYLAVVPMLVGAAVVLAAVTAFVAWCNLAVVAATEGLRRGEGVSPAGAVAAATRRLPHALLLGALVGGTLLVPWLAEHSTLDRHRWRFARLFGRTYSAATVLAGPAAVLDGASPLGAFRRSSDLLADRFGSPVMVRMGAVRRYGGLGLAASLTALAVTAALGTVVGGSPSAWLARDLVAVAVAAPLWAGVVYGSAVGAVLETLLYVALRDGDERLPLVDAPVEDAVRTLTPDDGGQDPGLDVDDER